MRLIDADKLLKDFSDELLKIDFDNVEMTEQEKLTILTSANALKIFVKNQPIAIDEEQIREDERRKFAEWLTKNEYLKISAFDCEFCNYKDSDCNGSCYDALFDRYYKEMNGEQNDES